MQVKYSYLEQQFANQTPFLEKIAEVVKSGDFTLGKEGARFEEKFAKLIGTKYAIGVNSGTDALFLSLKAIDVGPGDEVITAVNTFIATAGAIAASGARPVYVDVNDEYGINADLIEAAITPRTKVLMPVHYAGVPADMDKILEIARKHGLPVVEDSCQAIGAAINGSLVGSLGISGGFSLHPLKNLNVWGDSGIIVTNSEEVCNRLILLRNHGLVNRNEVEIFGYNSRLDSVQAAVGNCLIDDIHRITEIRIRWAIMLDEELGQMPDFITVPKRRENKRYVHHLYMIMVKDRDKLLKYLIENGIEAKIHYPIPLHLQKCSAHLGYKKGDFSVAEAQAQSIITLPVHQHLNESQIDYMIKRIKSFYGQKQ